MALTHIPDEILYTFPTCFIFYQYNFSTQPFCCYTLLFCVSVCIIIAKWVRTNSREEKKVEKGNCFMCQYKFPLLISFKMWEIINASLFFFPYPLFVAFNITAILHSTIEYLLVCNSIQRLPRKRKFHLLHFLANTINLFWKVFPFPKIKWKFLWSVCIIFLFLQVVIAYKLQSIWCILNWYLCLQSIVYKSVYPVLNSLLNTDSCT